MAIAYKVAGNVRHNKNGYYNPNTHETINPSNPWEPWYAWRPVIDIHGAWHWLDMIYRKPVPRGYVNYDSWQRYSYGTEFDYLGWK